MFKSLRLYPYILINQPYILINGICIYIPENKLPKRATLFLENERIQFNDMDQIYH